jgi:tetratricopeptide (TPR) repeat protein
VSGARGEGLGEDLLGEYETATNYARQAIEATAEDVMRAYLYHSLGVSLIELGRAAEAEVALRRAAIRVNVEPLMFYSLGNSLEAQGRAAEADRIYARTLGDAVVTRPLDVLNGTAAFLTMAPHVFVAAAFVGFGRSFFSDRGTGPSAPSAVRDRRAATAQDSRTRGPRRS